MYSDIDVDDYMQRVKVRLLSGEMSEEEWSVVLTTLLHASEADDLDVFDDAIFDQFYADHPELNRTEESHQ